MRRSLTLVISLNWTALFSALSVLAVLDASSGGAMLAHALGGQAADVTVSGSAGMALAFALVASVFLWFAATTALVAEPAALRDVAKQASIVGAFLSFAAALATLAEPAVGSIQAFGAIFTGILVTAFVVGAWAPVPDESRVVARSMAAGAAFGALMPRSRGHLNTESAR